jgi:hypothetical protein
MIIGPVHHWSNTANITNQNKLKEKFILSTQPEQTNKEN